MYTALPSPGDPPPPHAPPRYAPPDGLCCFVCVCVCNIIVLCFVFFFFFSTATAAVTERELAGLLCRNRRTAVAVRRRQCCTAATLRYYTTGRSKLLKRARVRAVFVGLVRSASGNNDLTSPDGTANFPHRHCVRPAARPFWVRPARPNPEIESRRISEAPRPDRRAAPSVAVEITTPDPRPPPPPRRQ